MVEVGSVAVVESLKWSGGCGEPWRRLQGLRRRGKRGSFERSSALVR